MIYRYFIVENRLKLSVIKMNIQLNQIDKSLKRSIQPLRFYSQLFSLLINIWIGIEFYLFYRYLASGGETVFVERPPGVEGWLPIGSLVSLRYFVETGIVNNIHPSGLIIFVTILVVAFLFKKGFCSWVCPVGFISEMVGDFSNKLFKFRFVPPRWLDYPLRSIKYLLLLFFFFAVLYQMSSADIQAFIYNEYNKISDLLMLRFFIDISMLSLIVVAVLFILSFVIRAFWCRYLCPYGALLGLFNFISPTRIVRKESSCTNCSSCAKVCPAFIKVDKVKEVISDECIGCMACVDSCPVSNTLEIVAVKKDRKVSKLKWAVSLLVVFWGVLLVFKLFGPWQNEIPLEVYFKLIPQVVSGSYVHP